MAPLTTARLHIRPLHISDHGPLMGVFGDPEVMRFGDGAQGAAWAHEWLETCIAHERRHGFGPYAVVERETAALIGYCGLFYFPDVNGRPEVELGYRLIRSAWGRGYATEAATAVRDHAFGALGLARLIAMIDPQNTASIRVVEKLGMRYEQDVLFPGYTHPDRVYALGAP